MADEIRNNEDYALISERAFLFLAQGLDHYLNMVNNSIGQSFTTTNAQEQGLILFGRLHDVSRAITYDTLRYAKFHNISKISRDGYSYYDICESVFASYCIKWIVTIHPLSFDSLVNEPISVSTPKDLLQQDRSDILLEEFYNKRVVQLCNEHYAICVANVILSGNTPDKKYINIISDMEPEEKDAFLYSLRYRIKHQDVYTALLRRIHNNAFKQEHHSATNK
jgi:hypothetical protein